MVLRLNLFLLSCFMMGTELRAEEDVNDATAAAMKQAATTVAPWIVRLKPAVGATP